jgi:hypothetical protein
MRRGSAPGSGITLKHDGTNEWLADHPEPQERHFGRDQRFADDGSGGLTFTLDQLGGGFGSRCARIH